MADAIKHDPEPRRRGWMRYLLAGSAAAWVLAFLAMSFSMAGVITVAGALWLLVVGWVGGVTLFWFAEPMWGITPKRRLFFTIAMAVVFGLILLGAAAFEKAHGENSAKKNAAKEAPSIPAQVLAPLNLRARGIYAPASRRHARPGAGVQPPYAPGASNSIGYITGNQGTVTQGQTGDNGTPE